MTPATRELRTRSPAVGLLNAEYARSVLLQNESWPWPDAQAPRAIRIERVWPAAANALAVEWAFELADRRRYSLFATPVRPEELGGAEQTKPHVAAGALRGIRVELRDHGAILHSIDHDPTLVWLPECMCSSAMIQRLIPLWAASKPWAGDRSALDIRVLSYRARRRATLAYHGDGRRLIGKVFRDGRGERALHWHRELNDRWSAAVGHCVAVADPVAYLPDLHLSLFSWCDEAVTWSKTRTSRHDLQRAMQALAALHGTSIPGLPEFSNDDEVRAMERWRSALTIASPEAAVALNDLVPVWQSSAPATLDGTTIHRDFYGRQVMLSPDRVILVDLDTLSRGDPALDVGNLLAHLWLDSLQRPAKSARGAFDHRAVQALTSYREAGGSLRRDSLRWYWASALLRLSAVHALRTATGRYLDGLCGLAARVLETTIPAREAHGAEAPVSMRLPDVHRILREAEG